MSAVPVSVSSAPVRRVPAAARRPGAILQPATTEVHWKLTDRGIAVVMLVAAMILVAALVVIGLTAVRVTDPGTGQPELSDAHYQASEAQH